MERTWFLDGEVVPFQKIIELAREYGYESKSGIFMTSEAVLFLARNGHAVTCKESETAPQG